MLDDVLIVFEALVYIEKQLSASFKVAFERDIGTTMKPNQVLKELVKTLKADTEHEVFDYTLLSRFPVMMFFSSITLFASKLLCS